MRARAVGYMHNNLSVRPFYLYEAISPLRCYQVTDACINYTLWACLTKDIPEPFLEIPESLNLLSPSEVRRFYQFKFARDRANHLAARIMVRHALSKNANITPAQWEFSRSEYGKPQIKSTQANKAANFNISHCDGLVVVATSEDPNIGVDVESISRSLLETPVVRSVFTGHELACWKSLPPSQKMRRYLQGWTLKEAYLKARGMGLHLSPRNIELEFDDPRFVINFAVQQNEDESAWQFGQAKLFERFIISWAHKQH